MVTEPLEGCFLYTTFCYYLNEKPNPAVNTL